jgi:hypothetical protein
LTFKNKFFIIALENHISNGGFSLNYFKQIYLMEQQDIPQETLTFNLTPKSAVLIPKASSEYTGQGTQQKPQHLMQRSTLLMQLQQARFI